MPTIKIKRVYEPMAAADGFRILVDRLWPRGLKKEDAHINAWLKEIAPSGELRKWFNHEELKWDRFREKYLAELKTSAGLEELLVLAKQYKTITLVYSAKNEEHNQAAVLKEFLRQQS
jgi:uncharacterized protein YeaO (DUF488 family)